MLTATAQNIDVCEHMAYHAKFTWETSIYEWYWVLNKLYNKECKMLVSPQKI